MKSVSRFLPALVVAVSMFPVQVVAHHSFAAEFDRTKPVALSGVVTKLEWQNPHTRLYMDVADSTGQIVAWELELASPNGLMRAGWSRHSVQIGDRITVHGFLAKDGSRLANAATVTTSDGKSILSETLVSDYNAPK